MDRRSKKILAAASTVGGANSLVPVIKQLKTYNKIDVVVIAKKLASESVFESHDIKCRGIEDYGLDSYTVSSMFDLVQIESPDLVLVGTANQDEKTRDVMDQTLVLAAKKAGKKSLAVLDIWHPGAKFNDKHDMEPNRFLADKIAVVDGICERNLSGGGIYSKKIVITGNPHFSDLLERAEQFPAEARQNLIDALNASLPVGRSKPDLWVLYAGNILEQEQAAFGFWDLDVIRVIGNTLSKMAPDITKKIGLVISLHPTMSPHGKGEIRTYIEAQYPGPVVLCESIPTWKIVLAVDLVLVANSTVGVEAVYLEKPCISLQPGLAINDPLVVSEQGFIPKGYTGDVCKELLSRALRDSDYRQRSLEKSAKFPLERNATQKVIDLIFDMLKH